MGEAAVIRVAALTAGRRVPSARFRVRQHIGPLSEMGVRVREFPPRIDKNRPLPLWPEEVSVKYVAPLFLGWQLVKTSTRIPGVIASRSADVTWLQRELVPGYRTLEGLLGRPVVLDVDDAIWVARPYGPRSAAAIARIAAVVVAGNSYLADWFSRHNENVRVVPTAIDVERFRPAPEEAGGEASRFTVGWTGTAGNLHYLNPVLPALRDFMSAHPDVELKVIADRPPAFDLPDGRLRFVPWGPEIEARALRDVDVGIMPLPDDEWARGKCSFKMLQYMATGIPVIASPVGMNRDVLEMGEIGVAATTPAEWRDALEHLYREDGIRLAWGRNARRVATRSFERSTVAAALAEIFREVA